MNVKQLAEYIQLKIHQELGDASVAAAEAATDAAIAEARAEAEANDEDPDEAAAEVEDVLPEPVDDHVPTLEWCGRIAKKHAKAAKDKVGKMDGLKEDLLDRVKKDKDKKDKFKAKP
jgi:hypothetical protein